LERPLTVTGHPSGAQGCARFDFNPGREPGVGWGGRSESLRESESLALIKRLAELKEELASHAQIATRYWRYFNENSDWFYFQIRLKIYPFKQESFW